VTLAELDYRMRAGVHRLGRTGALGLALLAGVLAFYLSTVRPAQDELVALESRRAQLQKERPAQAARAAPERAPLEQFVGFFPVLASAPHWLGTVYAVAEREHLELLEGAYRLSDDKVLGLAHYRATLPVRGSYPQIRRFIAGVLDEAPAASLESVVFQRAKVGEAELEAKVAFTLHLRTQPARTAERM
jgi:hypothetical protein